MLLRAWREGDEKALEVLLPLVHDELRRIARRCLYGERANHSVQATELVNEAFLRLVEVQHPTGEPARRLRVAVGLALKEERHTAVEQLATVWGGVVEFAHRP